MMNTLLHPTRVQLELFSASPDHEDMGRLRRHLASCVRCQNELRSLRALRVAVQDLPAPRMSPRLFESVERRINAGEHVLLPAYETPVGRRRTPFRVAASIAAAVAFAAIMITNRSRPLAAAGTAGDLDVVTGAPTAPNQLTVTYHPVAPLASAESLVLHARLFAAGRRFSPTEQDYALRRRGDVFTGQLTLAPEVALATLTVASPDGQRIDDNDARGWEFISRDSAGRPTFAGLEIQNAVHGMDDWERAYGAAREMVRLYPEQPRGVNALLSASLALGGAAKADSVHQAFRPRFEALDQRYANTPVDADLMWQMVMLGNQVRDTAIARTWFDRMKREYPRDAGTIQLGVFAIFNKPMSDTARLRELDSLWAATGGASPQLLVNAFQLADKIGDDAAIERWGDRLSGAPGGAVSAAVTYARHDRLRPKAEILLRNALAALPPVSNTDWQAATRSRTSQRNFAQGQWQLATLGRARLRDGAAAAALDTLRRAAALAWDPATFEALGDAALALGDTSEAVPAYGWAIADRRTSTTVADSLRARLGAAATTPGFAAAVAEGEHMVRAADLSSTYRRSLGATATYADDRGARHPLTDALGSGLSVIAVVSRNCAPSIADLPGLDRLRTRLAPLGIPLLTVVEEAPNDAAAKDLVSRGFSGTVVFDDRAEVSHALRQYGTPQYFVIEGGKTMRIDRRRAEDLIGVIDALRR
jgi:hypothetical protein